MSKIISGLKRHQKTGFAYVVASGARITSMPFASATYVCDGTADQSEINTALGAYNEIYLSDGTFNLSSSVNITSSNKKVIGINGQTFFTGASGLQTFFSVTGSKTGYITASAEFDSANTSGNQIVFNGGTDLSAISAGDYIMIKSGDYYGKRTYQKKAEHCRVLSKSGTTLTLYNDLVFTYTNNVRRINKYTFVENVVLSGFKCTYDNTATGTGVYFNIITCNYCKGLRVSDVTVDGGAGGYAGQGICFKECLDSYMFNCSAYKVRATAYTGGANGHGFKLDSSDNCIISDCYAGSCETVVDIDCTDFCPIAMNNQVKNVYAFQSWLNCVVLHGGNYNCSITNCTADTCGKGFSLRGQGSKLEYCTVINSYFNQDTNFSYYPYCVYVGEDDQGTGASDYAGVSGTNLIIRYNNFNPSRSGGGAFTSTTVDGGKHISSQEPLINAIITNNTFAGLNQQAIYLEGQNNNDRILISDNNIDFDTQLAGKAIVQVTATSGAIGDFTFKNNTVTNAVDLTQPYVKTVNGGTSTETNNSVS